MFSEALNCAPEEMAGLLNDILQKCSNPDATLKQWDHAVLISAHKKGEETGPKIYRPILLLPHCRNVIESEIRQTINRYHKNNENQLGFQCIVGTETAVLRYLNYGRKLK